MSVKLWNLRHQNDRGLGMSLCLKQRSSRFWLFCLWVMGQWSRRIILFAVCLTRQMPLRLQISLARVNCSTVLWKTRTNRRRTCKLCKQRKTTEPLCCWLDFSAVMSSLLRSAVVRKELNQKAKLLICLPVIPTYGHEVWMMTTKTRSQIQAADVSFLCNAGQAQP